MIKFPQSPISPIDAPIPGRHSTYFNSPYMKQIATNLSAAIYGDPRDELVRQRISQSQMEMARQQEQDELAAAERQARSQAQMSLAGALPSLYGDDGKIDNAVWQKSIMPHAPYLGDQLVELMPRNSEFLRTSLLDQLRSDLRINEDDNRHENTMIQQDDDQEWRTNERIGEQNYNAGQDEIDRYMKILGMEAERGRFLPTDAYGNVDLSRVLENHAIPQNSSMNTVFDPNAPVNRNAESAAQRAAAYGGTGKVRTITASDAVALADLVYQEIKDASRGEDPSAVVTDPETLTAIQNEVRTLYEAGTDATTAVATVLGRWNIKHTEAFWPWEDPETTLTPKSGTTVIKFDAQGNMIP